MKQLGIHLNIRYDKSKPDGMPKKLLDVSLAKKYGSNIFKRRSFKDFKDFKLGYRT